MLSDYVKYIINNLKHRSLRSLLTMIGIFIGIAAVVSLIGLGEGLRLAILSQFGMLGTDVLTVQAKGLSYAGAPGTGSPNPLTDDLSVNIEKIPGVAASVNRYIKTATLEYNDKQSIAYAVSMPSGRNRKIVEDMMNVKVIEGRLLKDGDTRKVLLGSLYQNPDNWGGKTMRVGDRITLTGNKYEIVGILEKKGNFMIDGAVVIDEEQLLSDFGDTGQVNIIGIKVKNEEDINNVKIQVEKFLRKERDVKEGEEDFQVTTPQQILETLDSTLYAVQLFVTIIASISLVVGGIGITNTMYTSVLERTREIGIMKSVGARNSNIFLLFFLESGFLGTLGGIIGIILGLVFAYGGAYLGRLVLGVDIIQAHVSLSLILLALAFSFCIGLIAGVTPALRASGKNPVEALRYSR